MYDRNPRHTKTLPMTCCVVWKPVRRTHHNGKVKENGREPVRENENVSVTVYLRNIHNDENERRILKKKITSNFRKET